MCGFRKSRKKPNLPRAAEDAICGAVGEVAALVALYPFDTLKVQCQAHSEKTMTILRDVFSLGPAVGFRRLYAGVGTSAVVAGAIGSLYLLAFYSVKRLGNKWICENREVSKKSNMVNSLESDSNPWIVSVAGITASVVGSLVEAPIDQFKVRAQAGTLAGSIFQNMSLSMSQNGCFLLYSSLFPFLMKSLPHDMAELLTFSRLQDIRGSCDTKGTELIKTNGAAQNMSISSESEGSFSLLESAGRALHNLPESVGDMLIGAIAGVAAAFASMPFDTTFTKMHICSVRGIGANSSKGIISGTINNMFLFFGTAHKMVEVGGVRALFAGMGPRLMQTIPASVVFWMAVEGTRRMLANNFEITDEINVESENKIRKQENIIVENRYLNSQHRQSNNTSGQNQRMWQSNVLPPCY